MTYSHGGNNNSIIRVYHYSRIHNTKSRKPKASEVSHREETSGSFWYIIFIYLSLNVCVYNPLAVIIEVSIRVILRGERWIIKGEMNDGRWCSSCIEREMKTVSAAVAASSCAVFVPLPRTGYRFFFRTRTQIHTPSRYATILLLLSLYSLSYHIYRLSPLLHFSFRTFFVCPVHCRRYFLERSQ